MVGQKRLTKPTCKICILIVLLTFSVGIVSYIYYTNPSQQDSFHMVAGTRSSVPPTQASNYVCDRHGPPNNHSAILRNYCSKVPIPSDTWRAALNYNESDVGFLIFTGSIFFHTRATAARDTWLSRVTHKYFLSAIPYPWLPVTVVAGAGEDKLSNMKKVFYGLQIVYRQQQGSSNPHKWYYIAGCDTFVNVHHVLKRLDPYPHTKPLLVGGHSGEADCRDSEGRMHTIKFPSGGPGLFLSSKLMEMLMPHLTDYVDKVWPSISKGCSECSDVALTCLIFKLGIRLTEMPGFWHNNPDQTLVYDGRKAFFQDPEPNNYHYVPPAEMYDLDEFYAFQFIDRLVRDHNWQELTAYTRTFVASHYETLRVKRSECTLPAINTTLSST